jgi:hypothetical protein
MSDHEQALVEEIEQLMSDWRKANAVRAEELACEYESEDTDNWYESEFLQETEDF